ncbi:MAG TPA: fumarylacetoacetate hydrolase family protein [Pirellulales bacterium]|nr:fumarylacetoacetate hydrolase family protein [Pirellulales bacterium]
MHVAKIRQSDGHEVAALVDGSWVLALPRSADEPALSQILEAADPAAAIKVLAQTASRVPLDSVRLMPPIDGQEVWAAGVTYRRSQVARMEESRDAASFYDRVYVAARPELFLKATPHRVVGHGGDVRIRRDAVWNVPEPELALVLNSRLELVGFTVGNDMSSRDIEGENPLYLPQAKIYDGCCGLGPWITLATAMPPADQINIELQVIRDKQEAFHGATSVGQMARTFDDLIEWLRRDNSFPAGVILLTGTGIVPSDDFTLSAGDVIHIAISGIGTLTNHVTRASVD